MAKDFGVTLLANRHLRRTDSKEEAKLMCLGHKNGNT